MKLASVSQAIPKLQLMTTEHVNQMIQSNTTTVGEEISHKYTLDVPQYVAEWLAILVSCSISSWFEIFKRMESKTISC